MATPARFGRRPDGSVGGRQHQGLVIPLGHDGLERHGALAGPEAVE
jgi:hypothetical protein